MSMTKNEPAAVNKTDCQTLIEIVDRVIKRVRKVWLTSRGEQRAALRNALDELLDDRLKLMQVRDAQ